MRTALTCSVVMAVVLTVVVLCSFCPVARAVLIYDLAKRHLVEELKYPPGLIDMEYDKEFAIMVSFFFMSCGSSGI